ncbi:MAG: M13 family metallopeptidase [Prevotella sp.]|nr:M13 family metallopeptidase [Prevotella sp.]
MLSSFSNVIPASAQQLSAGIKAENMDLSARPGDDFYQYACGGWMKNNPLPAAYSRYGSFDMVGEAVNKQINDILTTLADSSYARGTVEQKVRDLYLLAMDSVRRNNDGLAPIKPYLAQLEAVKTLPDLQKWVLQQVPYGMDYVYGTYFGADEKDSRNNILNIYQSGLTLRQKEFYVSTDSASLALLEQYRRHIERMFVIAGFSASLAEQKMRNVMDTEMRMAQFSRTSVELRDSEKNYNKMSLTDFEARYPQLLLVDLMQTVGVSRSNIEQIVVGQPEYCEGLNALLGSLPAEQWRDYFEWQLLNDAATLLSDDLRDEDFHFNGEVRRGRKEQRPRWRTATDQVQSVLGQALGRIYVAKYFPASAKERMEKLVKNLQTALGQRIDAQEWMTPETKKVAHEKLSTFYVKIGYPNKWDDISGLTIDPALTFYENMRNAAKFRIQLLLSKTVGKPVDRDEWHMYPQTVNAYYNPTTNEICFPAGILQYPFFDNDADDAFNYGAIGVVIGHEMTHGFDDQGSHYDKDGNMRDWWQQSDVEKFKALGNQYAEFFDGIEILPGLHANGKLTLGENLADHGGLMVSYQAFKNVMQSGAAGDTDSVKKGLTPQQRFFVAYAGVWAQNITDQERRTRLKTDVHSQGEWRVKGALPHIKAWYDAFDVKPTDKLYLPEDKRLNLW